MTDVYEASLRAQANHLESEAILALLVVSAGGSITVRREVLEDAFSFVITKTYDPTSGATTYSAKDSRP